MREAKRRKANDPLYGVAQRGLVIGYKMEMKGDRFRFDAREIDPQELRFATLFLDKLTLPENNILQAASTHPDVTFLEESSILSRPYYQFDITGASFRGRDLFRLIQVATLNDLEKKETGVWALSQGLTDFLIELEALEPNRGITLELFRAIPVPDKDVHLNKILEFKSRRRDELGVLRGEIELFTKTILGSDDNVEALHNSVRAIDGACASVLRLGAEWQFPVRLTSLKASF